MNAKDAPQRDAPEPDWHPATALQAKVAERMGYATRFYKDNKLHRSGWIVFAPDAEFAHIVIEAAGPAGRE